MELTNFKQSLQLMDGTKKTGRIARRYFSEFACKYRVWVEVKYFLFLADQGFFELESTTREKFQKAAETFDINNANKFREIEKITNHDVKAVSIS